LLPGKGVVKREREREREREKEREIVCPRIIVLLYSQILGMEELS
jgi:hypothetical protein